MRPCECFQLLYISAWWPAGKIIRRISFYSRVISPQSRVFEAQMKRNMSRRRVTKDDDSSKRFSFTERNKKLTFLFSGSFVFPATDHPQRYELFCPDPPRWQIYACATPPFSPHKQRHFTFFFSLISSPRATCEFNCAKFLAKVLANSFFFFFVSSTVLLMDFSLPSGARVTQRVKAREDTSVCMWHQKKLLFFLHFQSSWNSIPTKKASIS